MKKIIKSSLEEQAADYLRELILSGHFRMGQRLVESALARELELSRSTVRMALNTLAHEGIVVQTPYVGWQVIDLNEHDLWELFHLRVALEPISAWLAAERLSAEGRERLRQMMNLFLEKAATPGVDSQELSRMELSLHSLIVELSENQRLYGIYQNVANQMLIYFNIDLVTHEPAEIAASHQPLVDAICAGNAELASRLAKENITTFSEIGEKFKARFEQSRQRDAAER
ncbi:GntR family transcriptional regulator [Oceanimonas sp. MB9]|uniref:GntR family transcriptional regulator n=1 Tax=Oceanimonas sp. MB9 TaxID=2588453 RepID=UPI0013F69BC9|nr:GntR family transcriptional regulator [Oceanimonas sp. MB9]NHH99719.1 putative D-xylose utilization operon transcriptional repressor [Oceanimonas sp. MB9]